MVKTTKEALEKVHEDDYDEEYFNDFDDLPRHY